MNKEKGFTLIELLAVIVILAIIALIATPLVLSVIEGARKDALKNTLYNIEKAGELYIIKNINKEESSGAINEKNKILLDTYLPYKKDESKQYIELDYKGGQFQEGRIIINSDSSITSALINGKYCAYRTNNKEAKVITKKETSLWDANCILEDLGPKGPYIGNFCPGEMYITEDCIELSDEGEITEFTCDNKFVFPSQIEIDGIQRNIKSIFNGSPDTIKCVVFEPNYTEIDIIGHGEPSFSTEKIKISEGTKIIKGIMGTYANLKEISLPDSLEEIHGSFSGTNFMTLSKSIVLPKNLKVIGDNSFNNAIYEGVITIPEKVEKIGASAFSSFGWYGSPIPERKKEIIIPASVKTIGSYAFAHASIWNGTTYYSLYDEAFIKGDCNRFGTEDSVEFKEIFGPSTKLTCETL